MGKQTTQEIIETQRQDWNRVAGVDQLADR
jgi:hypothetical protein